MPHIGRHLPLLNTYKVLALLKLCLDHGAPSTSCSALTDRRSMRAGDLLRVMPKNTGGNPNLTGPQEVPVVKSPDTLNKLGISKNDSSAWQKLAVIPEPELKNGWCSFKVDTMCPL